MNEIDANLTKATEEHASKAQGMESSLEENQRSLEESQRSLEEKQRALEEKERALEDAKRSLDESHLALASMTQACKKADDQILATQQQAAKNFQKTLEEGVIMVKHCRGKKKKHAKVSSASGRSPRPPTPTPNCAGFPVGCRGEAPRVGRRQEEVRGGGGGGHRGGVGNDHGGQHGRWVPHHGAGERDGSQGVRSQLARAARIKLAANILSLA